MVNWPPISSSPPKTLIASLTQVKYSNAVHLDNSLDEMPEPLCGSPQALMLCVAIRKLLLRSYSKQPSHPTPT